MIPLGSKLAPSRGVISWNNSKREGRINFVGKLTQVSDSGPSWPSCLNCVILVISIVLKETTLTILVLTCEPVSMESEIV